MIAISIGTISYLISNDLKVIFNQAILNNQINIFSTHLIQVIIFFIIMFLLNVISFILDNLILWKGSKNIVVCSVRKLLKTDYDYFLKAPPSAIWTELNMSAQQTSGFYSSFIELSSYIIEFVVYGFIIINISLYAGFFSICVIPLSFLMTFWMQKKLTEWRIKILDASKQTSTTALEIISSAKDIKSKNAYEFFLEKLNQTQSTLAKSIVVSSFYENYWSGVTSLISSIAPLIVIYLLMGITNIVTTKPGDIIVLYSFIPLFLSSFKKIYSIVLTYFTAHPFIETSKKYITLPEEKAGTVKIKNFKTLTTKDINVVFDNGQSLKIPNINVKKGDRILLMGESGIGKSTLFNILLGMRKNFSGSLEVNGVKIHDIDMENLRNIIGISFQNSGVFSLSLKENILLNKKNDVDFNDIIDITNLKRQLKEKKEQILNIDNLSGGEKSRISMAQNLIRNPEVILIDESLSNVDERMESEIISNIIKNFNDKTIICISHRENSKKYFDRVIKFERISDYSKEKDPQTL